MINVVETASKARSPSKVAALHANSTTGLILENRPNHLPSKPKQEELKHRQQYLQMLENAKRKAAKEVAIKEKLTEEKYDREEILRQSGKKWIEEIIPNWQNMRHSSTVQQIWWQGIPPNIRGKIWKLALDFRLDISADLYKVLVEKTDEKFKELALNEPQLDSQSDSPLIQIKLDISRTFPNLGMFQVGGPYHASLFEILGAYTQFKPTVGYIQGMSFLAAVFLLNMEPLTAFACFANLLEKPCQKSFYEMKTTKMQAYYQTFDGLFYKNLPKLFNHFTINNVTPDMYLCNWIYTLYSHSLPLDVTCRIWDIVFRDGDIFIFRTALGILSLYKSKLMDMKSIQIAKFLTKLPDDVDSDLLFDAINDIRVTKNRYNSMLLQHFENFNCK
ncbi:uncharacterized protein TRIADDRAFT_28350 [Trichoplax adhaerens]|uniref:Rab-GAP TBC domain-containing protein n=1 Tax=Trichoplax adhaerens TaxID=10228 RepID=B3S3A1_TRIAD|nr:hypothetical protein TRIADDRAFT_28350 [Trichoplax adhaerens]EDV22752.1 hypothetical protein TRIADDRAFT_28350 [Trichoplax adhaerens]|eukprot:XP_002114618.1 hypothetical protein TRIADDRAFT_28350 [Trichoplax adhaerens]